MGKVQKYTFSISKKSIIIGKLIAVSKKTSFELRYRQEQLVEVEGKILVLLIGSEYSILRFHCLGRSMHAN